VTAAPAPAGATLPAGAPALLAAALALARHAGAEALAQFGRTLQVETKADGSPVTIADRAAERAMQAWLEARFPSDGILGEEFGAVRPGAPRRWIVDPIDGTQSFIRGVPLWATLVAVCEGEHVLAGAAAFPALGEWIAAAPGAGCWWNGGQARVSEVDALERALVLCTEAAPRDARAAAGWRRLAAAAARARTWGDAYGYLLVATGRAEVMLDPVMAPWDAAPLQPIVTEAGGVLTAWDGRPTAFGGSTVATNAALARAVRDPLAEAR
jgi:histidinol-phosphatase